MQTNNDEIIKLVESLIQWHQETLTNLREMLENKDTPIHIQVSKGESITLTAGQTTGFRLGIHIALNQFGILPISLTQSGPDTKGD